MAAGPGPIGRIGRVSTPAPRYQRTFPGLVAAMLVVVLVVVGWVAFRALTSDHESTPVRTVDWKPWVKAGQDEGKLAMMAPAELPTGWRATSVSYQSGVTPSWHLGMLTDDDRYVGLEERQAPLDELVREHVDKQATQGKPVRIGGRTWHSFTDSGGDYAVGYADKRPGQATTESWLVVGSAPPAEIRDFAASLTAHRGS